uniref:RING-type E3 ubiquitin transferase n=1 Tax=Salix viminalis TaxID=40686 RepID=A0A6N2LBG2_SALVM
MTTMWLSKGHGSRKKRGEGNGLVAVAVDKDKGSQNALKWAMENLLSKGQTVVLIHVFSKSSSSSFVAGHGAGGDYFSPGKQHLEKMAKDLFLAFRCYCTRKDVHCLDVALESTDIAKAITEYVAHAAIETLVLGTPSRSGFMRKFKADVPSAVSRGAPDFCTVYAVSKGKVSSMRNASRAAPFVSPLLDQIKNQQNENSAGDDSHEAQYKNSWSIKVLVQNPIYGLLLAERTASANHHISADENFRSPFGAGRYAHSVRSIGDVMSETDISFVSSNRPSTDRMSSATYDFMDSGLTQRLSTSSATSFASIHSGPKFTGPNSQQGFSSFSHDSGGTSFSGSTHSVDDMESEMRRLKLELKQTMEMYSEACREALTAKQKATELNRWRIEEERRMEESRFSEEAALSIIEHEKARCREAIEAAEAAKRKAEIEAQRRVNIEKALIEAAQTKKSKDNISYNGIRYRRYSIEEIEEATQYFSESKKIGEGGYGPVYKCYLDHTPVAVKVEVLSLIRHPNMVLLIGACPEYGILVYEHLAKGSLDDCLFKRGNAPALSWQIRFRIAAEIATGLLFLHQTKPEPLVHRDLKPGNILLDNNYTSKIGDVGLARLVPAAAENVTQYHMTSAAGTFCYIDPEYQQTGMLGVKSDVYSLGIMLLQIITARPPMGLTHIVEQAIENGTFKEVLDPDVPDWPVEEALSYAKVALQCAELRRKDRPDLGTDVLPKFNKLRDFAEEKMNYLYFADSFGPFPNQSQASITPPLSQTSMTPTNLSQASITKEGGEIFFFYRPKVEKEEVHSPDDVQRLYFVLRPDSGERAVEEKQEPNSGKQGSQKGSSSTDDHHGGSSTISAGKNESEGGHC